MAIIHQRHRRTDGRRTVAVGLLRSAVRTSRSKKLTTDIYNCFALGYVFSSNVKSGHTFYQYLQSQHATQYRAQLTVGSAAGAVVLSSLFAQFFVLRVVTTGAGIAGIARRRLSIRSTSQPETT